MRCATALRVSASLSITKPGFTPVPTSATPSSFAAVVEFLRKLGMFAEWIGKFFAGGNDAAACGDAFEELVHHAGEVGGSGVDNHVHGFFEDGGGVRGNQDAPRRIAGADYFSEIPAGFGGVFINRADDFKGIFLAHQADDGGADRAEAVLDDANFHFHDGVPG